MAFPHRPIKRLLVANRGEIATRILSTARELDIETYSLYTSNDTSHTLGSSHAIQLSSPASYLDIAELISIARTHAIDTIHPGYGFLSESSEFAARAWTEASCIVLGPGPEILARTGDKLQARLLADECHVPVLPALAHPTSSHTSLHAFATHTGYPIIIKAVDGGGGRGIRIVRTEAELAGLAKRALHESPSGQVFAEKAALDAFRHIEVQIIGDGLGGVRHLWERECSIQRRFQKVVEFAPSSIADRALIAQVIDAAMRMARHVKYLSLGTFEFLVRDASAEFYFLEVNPRLQVEHTVTEALVAGLDLVRMQMQLAQGTPLSALSAALCEDPDASPPRDVHAIQMRVTAEDAANAWRLSVGRIGAFRFPAGNGVRVDTHLLAGRPGVVGTEFDSLLAKIVVVGSSWGEAVRKARRAACEAEVRGVRTSLDVLRGIITSQEFERRECDTRWLEENLATVLERGRSISGEGAENVAGLASMDINPVAAASGTVLFRKGDAWTMTLTPESSSTSGSKAEPRTSHLEVLRIKHNAFPSSLSASILYSSASCPASPFTLSLTSTSASAASTLSTHRRGDAGNASHVLVPVPGKLVEVCVEVGDVLRKGETVAVVRQMKMELEVRAERGGCVTWVFEGEEGEDVGVGVLLAVIEGDGAGPKL